MVKLVALLFEPDCFGDERRTEWELEVLYIFILPGLDRSIALILASGEGKPLLDCKFGSVDRP